MSSCPLCGSKYAYLGFSSCDCPTPGCSNFCKKQVDVVRNRKAKEMEAARLKANKASTEDLGDARTIPPPANSHQDQDCDV